MEPRSHSAGIESDTESDSVFVPIADLFTLLSLSIIYVILTFGTQTSAQTTEPVLTAAAPGTGPAAAINPLDVYVSIMSVGNSISYSITRNGVTSRDRVAAVPSPESFPREWLVEELVRMGPQRYVIVYLPSSEDSDLVKSRYTDAMRLVKQLFPTQERDSI